MNPLNKMSKTRFYIIIILLSILIFSLSLEAIFLTKYIDNFDIWVEESKQFLEGDLSEEELFDLFISYRLFEYFINVILLIFYGIHSLFSYYKLGINNLFIFIWTVLLLGNFLILLASLEVNSFFYYFKLMIYLGLVINNLLLVKANKRIL